MRIKFALIIDSENAAFQPNPQPEIARILRETADEIESNSIESQEWSGHDLLKIYDINGNAIGTCGFQTFEDEDEND